MMNTIYIDSCAVNRLAEFEIDPIAELQGKDFEIAYTPDLKAEYKQALAKSDLCPQVRMLITKLLDAGKPRGLFGFGGPPYSGWNEGVWASVQQSETIDSIPMKERVGKPIPKNRTDAHLVAMAQDAIIITDNSNDSHWHKPPLGQGRIIFWSELKEALSCERDLVKAISAILS